jgi:hypothetical protein
MLTPRSPPLDAIVAGASGLFFEQSIKTRGSDSPIKPTEPLILIQRTARIARPPQRHSKPPLPRDLSNFVIFVTAVQVCRAAGRSIEGVGSLSSHPRDGDGLVAGWLLPSRRIDDDHRAT